MATIQTLNVHHFRNLEQVTIELAAGLNVIIGDNAAGKTSLIEALWVLSSGRSFRTHKPQQMIQQSQLNATIFCEVFSEGAQHRLGMQRGLQGMDLRLDGQSVASQTALARYLPIQLLTPESHRLLEEGPKARRQFLDWGCFYHYVGFMPAWRIYQRALKQRNQGIKQRLPLNQIRLWDAQLDGASAQISQMRSDYVASLKPYLDQFVADLMPELVSPVECRFYSGWPAAHQTLLSCLDDYYKKDVELGFTQYGSHRADLKFKIGLHEPLMSLSRGQQKLFVCALLLAQAAFLQKQTANSVVMLIDDLPAELDEAHRLTLLNLLDALQIQHIVTTTSQHLIPLVNAKAARSFVLQQGQIKPLVEGGGK